MTMDPCYKNLSAVGCPAGTTVFSEADYAADPGKVIAHAAATGIAAVVASDGRPRIIFTAPTADLPTVED
jgi:hypothetical protein